LSLAGTGQETLGAPEVSNYPHEETHAGSQNWQIAQDKMGYLYFANNSGLLSYNNKEWKLYPLPNKTVLRSLAISKDGKIFVGGQDAIGYFFPNNQGSMVYHSLLHLLDVKDRTFGDVWNVIIHDNEVFFRTSGKIYRYSHTGKRAIIIYDCPNGSKWSFMGLCNNTLYAQSGSEGFVVFDGNTWRRTHNELLKRTLITGVQPYNGDTVLIFTLRNGLYLFHKNIAIPFLITDKISKAQVYTAIRVNENTFGIGTVSGGIFFITRQGQVVRHFHSENGMQNNNVLSLFIDDQENLWAGLDEGIDRINFGSAIRIITPVHKAKLPIYAVLVSNNTLYAGTSDGVYANKLTVFPSEDIGLSEGSIYRINYTDGQVWNLSENKGKILLGHHDGAFLIEKNASKLLSSNGGGTWLFRALKDDTNVLTGSYAGIQSLVFSSSGVIPKTIPGNSLKESLRFVEIDFEKKIVWASHPYRGVYRIQMSAGFQQIKKTELLSVNEGLPSNINNFVFKINNEIVFATEKSIYKYDWESGKFIPDQKYQPVFGLTPVKFMVNDSKGRIWFATEKKMGVAENGKLKYFPEIENMLVKGFEYIYPFNDANIFVGGYKGIVHINYNLYKGKKAKITAWLNKVVAISKNDSLLFNGYFVHNDSILDAQSSHNVQKLGSGYNSFHFEYAANQFGRSAAVQYSYRLKGFDKDWSAWSEKTEKDYTNLHFGSYNFEVKAKDNQGNESVAVSYSFSIKPKWYQTKLANVLYFLLFIVAIWGITRIHNIRLEKQRIKFEKDEAQMRHLHELELEHNEREIIQLKNERLETELSYKNKELASTTMHLYKRGRLLGKIKEELADVTQNLKAREERLNFNKLVKLIAEEEKQDSDWEQFAIHFDQVHNQFLRNLKEKYPDLTPSDIKISAYIKMNLSSKEIAQLLNISLKGIEIARYRLRKKLNLESSVNLTDFIMNLS
jgi:ligand-binding sensor domain-containing protein/DNA-binding CsgD family transcriptional regulator